MDPEIFATWVVVSLLTAWLMSFVMRDGGPGRIWDVILGVAGGGAVSMLALAVLGPSSAAAPVAALLGAALAIVLQRTIWPRGRA